MVLRRHAAVAAALQPRAGEERRQQGQEPHHQRNVRRRFSARAPRFPRSLTSPPVLARYIIYTDEHLVFVPISDFHKQFKFIEERIDTKAAQDRSLTQLFVFERPDNTGYSNVFAGFRTVQDYETTVNYEPPAKPGVLKKGGKAGDAEMEEAEKAGTQKKKLKV